MSQPADEDPNQPPDPIRRLALFGGLGLAAALPARAQPTAAGPAPGDATVVLGQSPFAADRNGRGNALAAVRQALGARDTVRERAFSVNVAEGTYRLSGNARVLATIQPGTRLAGGGLEATRLRADPDANAEFLLSDDTQTGAQGSAAKVEVYDLTLDGAGNPRLRALLDLGTGGSIQFGTYGRLDNLLARDAPNATGFNLNTNIVAVGELYTMNTRDGIVTADGGSGCAIRGAYPYGFSRYGVRLGGIGDCVLYGEGEAPTSNDAVYIYGSRSFIVGMGSHILGVAKGTTLKRPFVIDTDYVADWALGPWLFIRNDNSQRYGDFARPTYRGTATAVGANTLTDRTQNWALDELKGWALLVTAGPGAGTWAEVAGNSRNTLRVYGRAWSGTGPAPQLAPSAGSRYALAPALCRASGGGFASSKVMTLPEAMVHALHAHDVRAGSLLVGASNDAARIAGVTRIDREVDLPALAANASARVEVSVPEVAPGHFVTVAAAQLREAGVRIEAECLAERIAVYLDNRSGATFPGRRAALAFLVTIAG
jgi:hypothetical protein